MSSVLIFATLHRGEKEGSTRRPEWPREDFKRRFSAVNRAEHRELATYRLAASKWADCDCFASATPRGTSLRESVLPTRSYCRHALLALGLRHCPIGAPRIRRRERQKSYPVRRKHPGRLLARVRPDRHHRDSHVSGDPTFAYLRVSKNDDVMTTANQRLELEQAGYHIDFWHEDTISGSTQALARPGFAAMLDKLRDGETLIVSKLDRLGRDAMDVIAIVRMLAERNIRVVVHALGGVDLASSTGKLLVTMLAAVAEMERDLLIERTHAGIARARTQGKHIGRPLKTSPEARKEIVGLLDRKSVV